jgi:pimeloyl-ACP methyl ester carboxylesterase
MPYTDSSDVRIYYEVEGEGPPLVLGYGLAGDVRLWRETDYIRQLRDHCTVVMFDARGHGRSDKPHGAVSFIGQLDAGSSDPQLRST